MKIAKSQSAAIGGVLLATDSSTTCMKWPNTLDDCAEGHLSKKYFTSLSLRGFAKGGNSGN